MACNFRMIITWIFVLSLINTSIASSLNQVVSPETVRNDETGELYNDAILKPMIKSLKDFVAGKRDKRFKYVPDDVALVQTISTLEQSIFLLSTFYASYETGMAINAFEGGIAIQFESQLCDNVYSSKFPRTQTDIQPWRFYSDSIYYRLHCKMPIVPKRARRQIEMVDEEMKSRVRNRRAPSVNTHLDCGSNFYFNENAGNISFPFGTTNNYSTNVICEWTIEVAPKYAVLIIFDYLQMEHDKDCKFDSIKFYSGKTSDPNEYIGQVCGSGYRAPIASKKQYMTIRFVSDDRKVGEGFKINWTITNPAKIHPGFVLTSTIVVDQVGDLNIDTRHVPPAEIADIDFEIQEKYELKLKNPSTCPLESDDVACYFETQPYIISKLVSTGITPNYLVQKNAIEVIFDHTIDPKMFPELYLAPKFCLTWNSSVKNTDYGSWSRRHGKVIRTGLDQTVCHFSAHGIHALAAAVPPPLVPDPFRFSLSWYVGLAFSIIWIFVTFVMMGKSKINIPDWLNMNQLLALMLFCCVTLTGIHLELHKLTCSILTFLLYYFGLGVFVWHLLKAAQFTGAFDKFFRRERNLYAFYAILGWGCPFFIAGMAGGAKLYTREKTQSCWFALKGGTVWGYTSPTYFLVLAILFLYYKGIRKTKERVEIYNVAVLRYRTIRDLVALILFLCTWIAGLFCATSEFEFAPQFFFSFFLCSTVVILCLAAKQKRRNFEKAFDYEDEDENLMKYEKNRKFLEDEGDVSEIDAEYLADKFGKKWLKSTEPEKLELALKIHGLSNMVVMKSRDSIKLVSNDEQANKWNNAYADQSNEGELYNYNDVELDYNNEYEDKQDDEEDGQHDEDDEDDELDDDDDDGDDDNGDDEDDEEAADEKDGDNSDSDQEEPGKDDGGDDDEDSGKENGKDDEETDTPLQTERTEPAETTRTEPNINNDP